MRNSPHGRCTYSTHKKKLPIPFTVCPFWCSSFAYSRSVFNVLPFFVLPFLPFPLWVPVSCTCTGYRESRDSGKCPEIRAISMWSVAQQFDNQHLCGAAQIVIWVEPELSIPVWGDSLQQCVMPTSRRLEWTQLWLWNYDLSLSTFTRIRVCLPVLVSKRQRWTEWINRNFRLFLFRRLNRKRCWQLFLHVLYL